MDRTAELQQQLAGFFPGLLGVRLTRVEREAVHAELTVRDELCTAPGILHGGACGCRKLGRRDVDGAERKPMTERCVSHSLSFHGLAGAARGPFGPLEGPRDHRSTPSAHRASPPDRPTHPQRR